MKKAILNRVAFLLLFNSAKWFKVSIYKYYAQEYDYPQFHISILLNPLERGTHFYGDFFTRGESY
ncbi:hypothetical protein J2S21_004454 [Peribacillus cavernae]|nr:hypothetical protein [Peribacillus cavernae]